MAKSRNQGMWVARNLRLQREKKCPNHDIYAAYDRAVSKTADVGALVIEKRGFIQVLVCCQCDGVWKTGHLFELKHP